MLMPIRKLPLALELAPDVDETGLVEGEEDEEPVVEDDGCEDEDEVDGAGGVDPPVLPAAAVPPLLEDVDPLDAPVPFGSAATGSLASGSLASGSLASGSLASGSTADA